LCLGCVALKASMSLPRGRVMSLKCGSRRRMLTGFALLLDVSVHADKESEAPTASSSLSCLLSPHDHLQRHAN
ncbi:hypothetical protein QT22_00535, partial [Staphylococcus aureus]